MLCAQPSPQGVDRSSCWLVRYAGSNCKSAYPLSDLGYPGEQEFGVFIIPVNSDGSDLLMWIKPGLETEFGRRWKGFGLWRLRGREYGSF